MYITFAGPPSDPRGTQEVHKLQFRCRGIHATYQRSSGLRFEPPAIYCGAEAKVRQPARRHWKHPVRTVMTVVHEVINCRPPVCLICLVLPSP